MPGQGSIMCKGPGTGRDAEKLKNSQVSRGAPPRMSRESVCSLPSQVSVPKMLPSDGLSLLRARMEATVSLRTQLLSPENGGGTWPRDRHGSGRQGLGMGPVSLAREPCSSSLQALAKSLGKSPLQLLAPDTQQDSLPIVLSCFMPSKSQKDVPSAPGNSADSVQAPALGCFIAVELRQGERKLQNQAQLRRPVVPAKASDQALVPELTSHL